MDEDGFRVPAHINFPNNNPSVKCLIFIDLKNWTKINDLMYHIKTLFDLSLDIWIYIDDMLLPKNESIKVIHRTDTIEVELMQNPVSYDRRSMARLTEILRPRSISAHATIRENGNASLPSTSNGHAGMNFGSINGCVAGPHTSNTTVDSTCVIKQEEGTDNVNENPEGAAPRIKRKRKHKKRTGSDDNAAREPVLEEGEPAPSPANSANDSKKHIRFSENEAPEADAHQLASPEETEQLRADLMALASKLKNEKTFPRKSLDMPSTSAASMEEDSPAPRDCPTPRNSKSTSTIEKPKVGDTISFTKIKLGEGYTPQMSGEIVGKILSVSTLNDKPTRVTMEIFKGSEEFVMPDGKFSLDDGENGISSLKRIEIHWHEVINPHFTSYD